jgi:hypothetical protein
MAVFQWNIWAILRVVAGSIPMEYPPAATVCEALPVVPGAAILHGAAITQSPSSAVRLRCRLDAL